MNRWGTIMKDFKKYSDERGKSGNGSVKVPASIACLENKMITTLLQRADVRCSEVNMQTVAARPRGTKRAKPSDELSPPPKKPASAEDSQEGLTERMLSVLDWLEPNQNHSHDPELECLRHRATETLNELL
eukprot:gb/GECG01001290.1/.p1 GENE.gb/GECG01001290.1/~~gb/GECG01001290.1/.p1  ORF type:complete len:131 (+),score=15.73 gb/GECG01001290.1/:1-393(+)